jgi:hypothetical protein
LDIKKGNIIACHRLNIADELVKHTGNEKYKNLIEYAYKLLLQNQAHDSICGCSTDDVHNENKVRYQKILQISDTIIDELTFEGAGDKVINLSDEDFSGVIEFESTKELPYQVVKKMRGFDKKLLTNTYRIPITEDYTDKYIYAVYVSNIKKGENNLIPAEDETDVFVTDKCIGNSNIFLSIEDNQMKIGDKMVKFIDFADKGDSYNTGYVEDDYGTEGEILS